MLSGGKVRSDVHYNRYFVCPSGKPWGAGKPAGFNDRGKSQSSQDGKRGSAFSFPSAKYVVGARG